MSGPDYTPLLDAVDQEALEIGLVILSVAAALIAITLVFRAIQRTRMLIRWEEEDNQHDWERMRRRSGE